MSTTESYLPNFEVGRPSYGPSTILLPSTTRNTPARALLDWLAYNGFTVVSKPIKEFADESGRRKTKGNMGIEPAVGAMQLAEHLDEMFLFSGDGGFRSLVKAVQRRGVRVTVVSSFSPQPTMIADELRRQADDFIDLAGLQSKIER